MPSVVAIRVNVINCQHYLALFLPFWVFMLINSFFCSCSCSCTLRRMMYTIKMSDSVTCNMCKLDWLRRAGAGCQALLQWCSVLLLLGCTTAAVQLHEEDASWVCFGRWRHLPLGHQHQAPCAFVWWCSQGTSQWSCILSTQLHASAEHWTWQENCLLRRVV